MTLMEKAKMKHLLDEAIATAKSSNIEFERMTQYRKMGQVVEAEISQRKADNYRGYAEGIHQALALFHCKFNEMEELEKLLK